MTVPSQYKGFSKLPEHVQQKMDPELAKKYNMGGGVLQRPLFRQMGGPAEAMQPAPMPAPPPPPPPIPPQGDPMVQQTEAQFANIGEQLAQDTMRNIDQAQDIEGAINGLRGNEKPIEARYDELASFVGQSDAQQTPESVLAMVQPTIMMTEQGAMDSGIGELIQSIAGSDMETPTGEPTPMGQGVGELMAMGAGNTPPVNFNQGGPVEVRRYALGDPQGVVSRATQLQSEFLPLFQQILGTEADRQAELDEIKRMQRSQAAFDVARAGLALASPTDRPMSFVEKLAAAATPLTTSLQQRRDIIQKAELAQKAQDRQAETSALTAALGQAQKEAAQAFDLKKLGAQAQADLRKAKQKYGFDVALRTLDFTNEKAINIQVEDLKRKSEELKQTRGFENDLELQAEKAEIDKTLAKFKGAMELENNLTLQGVKSADKINEMKEQAKITEAINATQQAYSLANKEVDQKNSLIKQAIEIAAQDSRQDKSIAANEALARLKNTFDVEESDKDRVFQAAQNELTRLLTERGLTLDEAKFEADQILNNEKLILQKKEQAFNQEIKTKEVARDRFELTVVDDELVMFDKDNQKVVTMREAKQDPAFGSSFKGLMMNIVTDQDKIYKYANDLLKDTDLNVFEQSISSVGRPEKTIMSDGSVIKKPPIQFSKNLLEAFQTRKDNGLDIPSVADNALMVQDIQKNLQTFVDNEAQKELDIFDKTIRVGEMRKSDIFGRNAFLKNLMNVVTELLIPGVTAFSDTKEGTGLVNALNYSVVQIFRSLPGFRDSVFAQQKIDELTPKAGQLLLGPDGAIDKALNLVDLLKKGESELARFTELPDQYIDDFGTFTELKRTQKQIQGVIQRYQLLIGLKPTIYDGEEIGSYKNFSGLPEVSSEFMQDFFKNLDIEQQELKNKRN